MCFIRKEKRRSNSYESLATAREGVRRHGPSDDRLKRDRLHRILLELRRNTKPSKFGFLRKFPDRAMLGVKKSKSERVEKVIGFSAQTKLLDILTLKLFDPISLWLRLRPAVYTRRFRVVFKHPRK